MSEPLTPDRRQRLIEHLRGEHRVSVDTATSWERVERMHGADHDLDDGWDHPEAHDRVWGAGAAW